MRGVPLLLCVCLVLGLVVSTRWLVINVSDSMPLGVYRVSTVPLSLPPGAVVVVQPPKIMDPWWPSHMPLLKPVAAVAGDEVCHVDGLLLIAGVSYGPIYAEAARKALPHLDGCHVVPEGHVFLASAHPHSLDGRYFGMTPIATLTAQAVPLWTWR